MKKNYNLNIVSKTLTITKDFEEALIDHESEEYRIYAQLMADFPNLQVVRRTHKTPTKYKTKSGEVFRNRNQFKNLTYERMEAFIKVFRDKKLENDYKTVKIFAEASSKNGNGYKVVRNWFLDTFSEYRTNPAHYLNNGYNIAPISDFLQETENKTELKKAS